MADKDSEKEKTRSKPGPKSETVIIKEQWEDAVKIALLKEKPKEGWPKD